MQDIVLFLQQHWQLTAPLIVVLVLLILIEFIKQKQSAAGVSPVQLTQMINHENAVIIDVRSTDMFVQGHIINATSIPAHTLEESLKKIEKFKSQPIVLVCAAGADSSKAAATLQKNGFKVHTLAGGMRAWREAELPIIK
jgi:rhodanese-related sulfurtransferase